MGGATAHGQHNKSHKTGKHAPKGQRHKQREAKGAPRAQRRRRRCASACAAPDARAAPCAAALPGAKRMLLLVEKNPSVLSAVFDVSDAVDANFSTRVKMGQSSNVFAVALMADGKVLYAVKEIKVTLGGCGG
jgi:hypothetical protein